MNGSVKSDAGEPARIGFQLSQIGAEAARRYADLVRPLGLTPAGAGVLRVLARSSGISQRELAERLGTGPSRVVALLDGLEADGFVVRTRDDADRRTQRIALTEAGETAMHGLRDAAERLSHALTASLDEAERASLVVLVDRLAAGLGLDRDIHAAYRGSAPPDGR